MVFHERLLVEPLRPGTMIRWISLRNPSSRSPIFIGKSQHLSRRRNATCAVASTGSDNENRYRKQVPKELPWEAGPPLENEPVPQEFGLQRTPWDRKAPTFVLDKSRRSPQGHERSVMVDIVEKLNAIERKELAQRVRFSGNRSAARQRDFSMLQQQPRQDSRFFSTSSRTMEQSFSTETASSKPQEDFSSSPPRQVGDMDPPEDIVPWSNDKFKALERFHKPPASPSMAELTIPEPELRRLQRMALRVSNPIKIGYLGVTKAVVEEIHRRWQRNEVLRVKCEGPPAVNMKRTHDELEAKTGGLVIWRTGGMAIIYRGRGYFARYENREVAAREKIRKAREDSEAQQSAGPGAAENSVDYHLKMIDRGQQQDDISLEDQYVNEIDALLAELGPRYDDWHGARPVPVDGDLLPAVVPKFRSPLRMLPYRVKPNLTNMELTVLRKLARPLPPHFVIGRNRGLQGLAAGILKLWEKSEIVKVGVKRGVENTRNQMIAEELKRLTGGVLLSRDKYFILLYRGKDFLPPTVATVLKERELQAFGCQDSEDRHRSVGLGSDAEKPATEPAAGSLAESLAMKEQWEAKRNEEEEEKKRNEALLAIRVREQRRLEAKLATAMAKKRRADMMIAKLEQSLRITAPPKDRETLTLEEKHLFRKLGLRMDAFMLIGRRGVFDGVIENMHLHWKHRELVKMILKERDKSVARDVANMLEAESGGVLVGVVTTSKGQAILMYRGKNYQRPPELRPKNLLTKRKALQRSKELQRKECLEQHISKLETLIQKLRKDYDFMLTSSTLPESPRSALYKEIEDEYEEDDEDDEILNDSHFSDDDELLNAFGGGGNEEEDEHLRRRDDEEDEQAAEDESEWDLESEDEEGEEDDENN